MSQSQPLPSNRSFGALFVVVFGLVAGLSWWRGGSAWTWWLAAAAVTLAVTLLAPSALTPLNRAWMRLADLMHRVVSPVVLGVIFFGMLTPIGWIRRRTGRDPMARGFDPAAGSYWVEREPPGPPPESIRNQF